MDFDVVVVGGGPAGLSAALFFASCFRGAADRIAVLEKATYPRDKICAGAIGARADRLLASVGCTVDVPSVSIHGLAVTTSGGRLAARSPAGAPIGRVVRRIEYDAALADRARERRVPILEGTAVSDVAIDDSGVRLSTSRGEVRAHAVVGADGVGSMVRKCLGISKGELRAQVVEVDTPVLASDDGRETLHFDLTDRTLRGYAWDFPTVVDGRALVCRGVYEIRRAVEREGPGDDVSDRLSRRLVRIGMEPDRSAFKRYAQRGLSLHEPFARPRALLIGEAAGIDPVLGEGIAQAVQYGAVAGRYLARAIRAREHAFTDWPRAFWRSRVGVDLAIRTRALGWMYGRRTRPAIERWITASRPLADSGMRYFAGDRVSRVSLSMAALELLVAAARRDG